MTMKVAVISSQGMGDALIQMIIANNLSENNVNVTYFSDYGYQLKAYINNYHVQAFPQYDAFINTFDKFHLVLHDAGSTYCLNAPDKSKQWLNRNAIRYHMNGRNKTESLLSKQQVLNTCADIADKQNLVDTLFLFNDYIRMPYKYRMFGRKAIAQELTFFLKNKVKLDNVTDNTGVILSKKERGVNKDKQRVLIHPTSSKVIKNWTPEKYLELAIRMKANNFEPIITVSPTERDAWLGLTKGVIEVPLFESIAALAEFYATADWFVGNDSGNAHLASMLGIPTFQLFGRWRKNPAWRAGWGKNNVLIAKLPHCLSRNEWQQGISVDYAYAKFIKFTRKYL